MASEIYHAAIDPEILKDEAKASQSGIEAHVKLKKIAEDLGALTTTPSSQEKIETIRNKVNEYIQDVLTRLLGLKQDEQ